MYEEHFSLSGAPFKLNPDPKFFFGSRSHNKAMAYLHYGLKQAEGFIVITGPIGSGKTMVISQLLDQLTSTNVIAAQLQTSNIAPEELLDHILSAFRIEPEGEGRTGKLEAFEDYLFDQLNRGRRVLLIMDEAQNLPFETLEELRMLSNIDYDGTPLFQVFLVGQPEFRDLLQTQRLEQLRQRVIASYHLENLTAEETEEYILHRLAVTGWREDPIFSTGGLKAIYEETGGRPRRINTVCNRILLYCSLEDAHEVTEEIAAQVIGELHEEELDARDAPHERMPAVKSIVDGDKAEGAESEELQPETEDEDTAPTEGMASNQETEEEAGDMSTDEKKDDAKPEAEAIDENDESALAASDNDGDADDEPASSMTVAANEETDEVAGEEDEDVELNESADASTEGDASEREAEPKPEIATALKPGGGSVLDRIRAQRAGPSAEAAPSEATLEDVAAAIAVAKVGEPIEGDDVDEDEAMPDTQPFAPLKSASSKEWRKQVRDSIDETRGELKGAHASVRRLRKSLTEIQRRKDNRREIITASLQRAEALLDQVRKDLFK